MIKFSDLEQMAATIQLAKSRLLLLVANVTTLKFDSGSIKFNLLTIQGLNTISFLNILKTIE